MRANCSETESLPSYILRIASAHVVSPGQLLKHVLGDRTESKYLVNGLLSEGIVALARPNGTTEAALQIIQAVCPAAAADLESATFLKLHPALARGGREYARWLRWCPACLADQARNGEPTHFKLAWCINGIRACGDHRVMLVDSCIHCGRRPPVHRKWLTMSGCPVCETPWSLVNASRLAQSDNESEAHDLLELLADLTERARPYPAGATNERIESLFEAAWKLEREEELYRRLPRDLCIQYSKPDEPVTLTLLRRLAFYLGCPLSCLLDPDRPLPLPFSFATPDPLPKSIAALRKRRSLDPVEMLERAKRFLGETPDPPSLAQVAGAISASVGAMRYHLPELCARIVTAHEDHLEAVRSAQAVKAESAVREHLRKMSTDRPDDLSRKRALRELRATTSFPKNMLRRFIDRFWSEISQFR